LETQSLGRIRRIGLETIIRREYGRIIRIWGQTLVPPAVTAALYFLIFGSLIGSRIGPMGGYDYMQYIAPGLIMMAVISNSYGNVVSSFFGAKFGKHIEELLVAPLPNWLIVLGYVSGGVMRGLLVGGVVTLVTLIFTRIPAAHPMLILGSVLLTAVVFALGGLFNAIFAKNFDQISWFPTFVLTPLIYLGGVFYSVSLLPDWAERLSYLNPILYMVNAFRHGFLGSSDVDLGFAFLIMGAFAAAMFTVVVMLMNRGTGIRE
jgi:ABC-2 type transport system permease protein